MLQPSHRIMTLAAALTTLGALAPSTARAYDWFVAPTSDEPMRWFREDVEVRVSVVEPNDLPWFKFRDRVTQAFEAWSETPDCRVPQVTMVGTTKSQSITTPTSLDDEPDNVVVIIRNATKWKSLPGAQPTTIALTFISHVPATGEIIDADIAINDAAFRFTVDDDDDALGVDLLSAITHEAGHFLGMGHSDDLEATMYADYGLRADDKIGARTLEQDDIDGICALYADAPTTPGPTGLGDPPPAVATSAAEGCAGGGASDGAWWLALGLLGGLTRLRRRPRAGAQAS